MNEDELFSLKLMMETCKYVTSDEHWFSKTYNFTMQINNEDVEKNIGSMQIMILTNNVTDFWNIVRAHSIWPPRAFALGQVTHQHLATARIDYLAS